jgi:DNA-binding transcriptional LysR family regulator
MKDKLVALLPAGHSLHHNRSLHVEQIAEEPFIMPKAGCEVLVQDMFRAAGVKPKVHFEIEDNQTILAMVEEGIGWTIVPQLTIPKYFPVSTAELVPETYRHIGLAVKSMSKITPAVKQFITAAQKYVTANHTSHTSAIAPE